MEELIQYYLSIGYTMAQARYYAELEEKKVKIV